MFTAKHQVIEVSDITADNIPQEILSSITPIIMKGLVKHWPLVQSKSPSECSDYLKSFYQGAKTYAFYNEKNNNGRYFYNNDLSELNFSKQQVDLSDVLDNLTSATLNQSIYVGSTNIDFLLPELKQQHCLPALNSINPLASIWLSNKSRIAAHQDLPSNIACCVQGKRRFTLFPPEQVDNLYIGPLDFTPAGQAISLVDFHQIDYQQYPKFKLAQEHSYNAELEPGDGLFVPSMWWHHVEGLESFNILINFWWNEIPNNVGDPIDALFHALLSIKIVTECTKGSLSSAV